MGKRLANLGSGRLLLLVQVVQLSLHTGQTSRHLCQCIVDTDQIATRISTQHCFMAHFSPQRQLVLLLKGVEADEHGKAPIAADLHRLGAFHFFTGV